MSRIAPSQLAAATSALMGKATGYSDTSGTTAGGRWKEFAEAAEIIAGASTTTSDTVQGYMLRAAVALEAVSGTSGAEENTNYAGLLKRIVDALEAKGSVAVGSLGGRLQAGAIGAVFTPPTAAPTVSARQGTTSAAANGTSFTPTLATHTAGQYLFVIVTSDSAIRAPDTTITTATAGWTRLYELVSPVDELIYAAVFYYGSGGTLTATSGGSTTAPELVCNYTEQYTAIAFTVDASAPPKIAASGTYSGASTTADPPALSPAGGNTGYLAIASAHYDPSTAIDAAVSAIPAGFSNQTTVYPTVAANNAMTTCERRLTGSTVDPGAFTMVDPTDASGVFTVAMTTALWV